MDQKLLRLAQDIVAEAHERRATDYPAVDDLTPDVLADMLYAALMLQVEGQHSGAMTCIATLIDILESSRPRHLH